MKECCLDGQSSFHIHRRCRKHVVFVDTPRIADVVPDVQQMAATGYPVEWNHIGHSSDAISALPVEGLVSAKRSWVNAGEWDALRTYLEDQPMGTHLYIAASWAFARTLALLAELAGYAPEDIQIRGYGQKYQHVFCISCYAMSDIGVSDTPTVTCRQCGKKLSVSAHYSRRLDAVLGYLMLDETTKKKKKEKA